MGVVVVPPGHGEPTDRPRGYSWLEANESEWVATQLKKGDRCWYRRRLGDLGSKELGPWTEGEFRSSMLYDGVHARIRIPDPDDLIEFSLFPATGEQLRATPPE